MSLYQKLLLVVGAVLVCAVGAILALVSGLLVLSRGSAEHDADANALRNVGCDVLTRRLTVRKNPSKKGSWDAPAVTVIRLLRQIQMGPPPQEGTLAHYPVGLPHSPRVLARKYRAQRLAALGLHVMPCAEVRAAPRVLGALAGVVHSCKGAPHRYEHQRCHDDGY